MNLYELTKEYNKFTRKLDSLAPPNYRIEAHEIFTSNGLCINLTIPSNFPTSGIRRLAGFIGWWLLGFALKRNGDKNG